MIRSIFTIFAIRVEKEQLLPFFYFCNFVISIREIWKNCEKNRRSKNFRSPTVSIHGNEIEEIEIEIKAETRRSVLKLQKFPQIFDQNRLK